MNLVMALKKVLVLVYQNGDKYEGEFKNNMFNGNGEMTRKDGTIEKGLFKNHVSLVMINLLNLVSRSYKSLYIVYVVFKTKEFLWRI